MTEDLDPTDWQEGSRVRVWWPPTADTEKTDFSGMYWPVQILKRESGNRFRVVYDNGEEEVVDADHVHPYDTPVEFGREGVPLQVGEFVEVFNGSSDDPAAWLAKVSRALSDDTYLVRSN